MEKIHTCLTGIKDIVFEYAMLKHKLKYDDLTEKEFHRFTELEIGLGSIVVTVKELTK